MTEQHYNSSESQTLIDTRRQLLAEFAERPDDDTVWQRAYDMVRQEGDDTPSGLEHTPAATVSAQELIGFADEVRAAPQADRYALTTRLASDGRYWFDALQTFSLDQPDLAKRVVLEHYADKDGLFERALDLGTGTGKSLWSLELVADEVVGLDRNPELLKIAAENKMTDTSLVQGQVTELPFADGSFDLISSRGLEGAMPDAEIAKLYTEIARVLRPDGIYVTSWVLSDEAGFQGNEMEDICRTSKAMLADMIVDTTSGGTEVQLNRSATGEDFEIMRRDAGLIESYFQVKNEADGADYIVSVISKPRI